MDRRRHVQPANRVIGQVPELIAVFEKVIDNHEPQTQRRIEQHVQHLARGDVQFLSLAQPGRSPAPQNDPRLRAKT